jgi:hypothetical protein
MADEVERPFQDLQPSHDDVQIHAVDRFHFQHDALSQDFGHVW